MPPFRVKNGGVMLDKVLLDSKALTTELRDTNPAAELPEHRALTTALLTELVPTEVPEPAAWPT